MSNNNDEFFEEKKISSSVQNLLNLTSETNSGYPNFSPYFRALCSIRRPTNSSPPQFAAIHGEFLLKKITSEKKFQRSIHSSPVVLVRYSGNTVVVN